MNILEGRRGFLGTAEGQEGKGGRGEDVETKGKPSVGERERGETHVSTDGLN